MKWRFIYRGFKARYRDERIEIDALVEGLSSDQIAIDVGANKGSYLWSLSRAVPNGHVIGFEPQPVLALYLRKACLAAGLSNVTIENAGCSIKSGFLKLAIPDNGEHSPGASFELAASSRENCRLIEVPVVALDDYFSKERKRIGAIKIDVEGHELAVLKGAVELINEHRPNIICECEQRHLNEGCVQDIIDFIQSLNYRVLLITKKGCIPGAEFDPDLHQKKVGERYWDVKGYYNNFLFKPLR